MRQFLIPLDAQCLVSRCLFYWSGLFKSFLTSFIFTDVKQIASRDIWILKFLFIDNRIILF